MSDYIYTTWNCTTCADGGEWEHTMHETTNQDFAKRHVAMTGHTVVETKWTENKDVA